LALLMQRSAAFSARVESGLEKTHLATGILIVVSLCLNGETPGRLASWMALSTSLACCSCERPAQSPAEAPDYRLTDSSHTSTMRAWLETVTEAT
jgi:hypothetical protein